MGALRPEPVTLAVGAATTSSVTLRAGERIVAVEVPAVTLLASNFIIMGIDVGSIASSSTYVPVWDSSFSATLGGVFRINLSSAAGVASIASVVPMPALTHFHGVGNSTIRLHIYTSTTLAGTLADYSAGASIFTFQLLIEKT